MLGNTNSLKALYKSLLTVAKGRVRKRGRRLSDLCFAKRTPLGYVFYEEGEFLWDVWEEIVNEVSQKFPEYSYAFVVDAASTLFHEDQRDLENLLIS